MRMHNIKRVCIVLSGLFLLLFLLVVSSVYFFNINDYSHWLSKQIKQTTGYDVRFEHVENSWSADNRFIITGLSLYQQQQQVLFINELTLQVESLDWWQRQLEISNIRLKGVDIDFQQPVLQTLTKIEANTQSKKQLSNIQDLFWERLHIAKFEISDLNASMFIENKSLLVKEADITLNDLLIIEQKQLQKLPTTLNILSKFKSLKLNDNKQKLAITNLQLSTDANLLTRQAELKVSADNIQLEAESQPALQLQSLDLQLQLEQNKLSLQRFFVNVFSGSLALKADADLMINLLPTPSIKIKKVQLHSLVAQELQLNIPNPPQSNNKATAVSSNKPLPIETLFIKDANFENISVHSESTQLPLTLKALDAQVNDYYLIKDNQLLDPTQYVQPMATFSLTFDYLRWQDAIIEQFSVAASLNQDEQGLRLLEQLLREQ